MSCVCARAFGAVSVWPLDLPSYIFDFDRSFRTIHCSTLSIFRGFLFNIRFYFISCVQFWFSTKSSVIAHKRSLILIINRHLVIDTFRSPFHFISFYFMGHYVVFTADLACIQADKISTTIRFITLWILCGSDTSARGFFLSCRSFDSLFDIFTEFDQTGWKQKKDPNEYREKNANDGRRV